MHIYLATNPGYYMEGSCTSYSNGVMGVFVDTGSGTFSNWVVTIVGNPNLVNFDVAYAWDNEGRMTSQSLLPVLLQAPDPSG